MYNQDMDRPRPSVMDPSKMFKEGGYYKIQNCATGFVVSKMSSRTFELMRLDRVVSMSVSHTFTLKLQGDGGVSVSLFAV